VIDLKLDVYHHSDSTLLETRLAAIESILLQMSKRLEEHMATNKELLEALRVEVERNTQADQSAVMLMNGLADQLQALLNANDMTGMAELINQLRTDTDGLAAAVAANTVSPPTGV
jgi:hypothetical protein